MIASSARREEEAIRYIVDLVYSRSRIRLHDGKQALIRARLGKRMRLLGHQTLAEYCDYLRADAGDDELTQVVDALATNYTSFMREPDHFTFLTQEALPRLGVRPGSRFRIWSAACATGEEPYSIAFHLDDRFPLTAGWNWEILATDISTKALAVGRRGVYPQDRLATVPAAWIPRCFDRGYGQAEGLYRVKDRLQERIRFEHRNLLHPSPDGETFQVIFCRNVMIYFDRTTQEQLVNGLARRLVSGGYLFTGHSESLNGLHVPVRCLRPSYFQRT